MRAGAGQRPVKTDNSVGAAAPSGRKPSATSHTHPHSQVCEVHVELSAARSSTRHTISAALAPDGSRAHKLNGRAKTGKEIKVGCEQDALPPAGNAVEDDVAYWAPPTLDRRRAPAPPAAL